MRIGETFFINEHKAPKDWQNIREKLFSLSDSGADHYDLGTATAILTSLPSTAQSPVHGLVSRCPDTGFRPRPFRHMCV